MWVQLSFRAGNMMHDMRNLRTVQLESPVGWVWVPLGDADPDREGRVLPIRAHILRISIDRMHQNGRDTHVRAIRVYGPRPARGGGVGSAEEEWSTTDMARFQTIR